MVVVMDKKNQSREKGYIFIIFLGGKWFDPKLFVKFMDPRDNSLGSRRQL